MSNEYKQCPNGHYYQGDQCPYCKSKGNGSTKINESNNSDKYNSQQETETYNEGAVIGSGENSTIVGNNIHAERTNTQQNANKGSFSMSGHTVFGYEEEMNSASSTDVNNTHHRGIREVRKLVGWLVSYTLDPLGIDFKLYEGRNIIGRDAECNITINDNWVSAKHAVLLFRAGKFSITDSMSAHGTFVNDTDIELEPYYLQDGDIIKMGQTVFKFRTAF